MNDDPRFPTPQKGYFEGMPDHMKLWGSLTVVMLVAGVVMLVFGNEMGLFFIIPVVLMFLLRLVLASFEIGNQTVLGYSIWYVLEHFERKYRYFPLFVCIAIIGFFAFVIVSTSGEVTR